MVHRSAPPCGVRAENFPKLKPTYLDAPSRNKKIPQPVYRKKKRIISIRFEPTPGGTDAFRSHYYKALERFFLSAQSRKLPPYCSNINENTLINKFQKFLGKPILLVEEITPQTSKNSPAAQTTISKKTTLNYHTGLSAILTWASPQKIARSTSCAPCRPPVRNRPDIHARHRRGDSRLVD